MQESNEFSVLDENSTMLVYGLGNEGQTILTLAAIAKEVLGMPGEVRGYNRKDSRVAPLITTAISHARKYHDVLPEYSGRSFIHTKEDVFPEIFKPESFGENRSDLEELCTHNSENIEIGANSDIVASNSHFPVAMTGNKKTPKLPDLILVCTIANAHSPIAKQQAEFFNERPDLLKDHDGKITYILAPGRFLGAWDFFTSFYSSLDPKLAEIAREKIIIGEQGTSSFASRIVDTSNQAAVYIFGGKNWNPLATIPEKHSEYVANSIRKVFPHTMAVRRQDEDNIVHSDIRFTTAASTLGGFLSHLLMTTMAFSKFYDGTNFYYSDYPSSPKIREALIEGDLERLNALEKIFGINDFSGAELMVKMYPRTHGDTLPDTMINNPAYQNIYSPTSLHDKSGHIIRYVGEELPYTVFPLFDMAKNRGFDKHPSWLNTSIVVGQMLAGITNLNDVARTDEKLGFLGYSSDVITECLKTGKFPSEL